MSLNKPRTGYRVTQELQEMRYFIFRRFLEKNGYSRKYPENVQLVKIKDNKLYLSIWQSSCSPQYNLRSNHLTFEEVKMNRTDWREYMKEWHAEWEAEKQARRDAREEKIRQHKLAEIARLKDEIGDK